MKTKHCTIIAIVAAVLLSGTALPAFAQSHFRIDKVCPPGADGRRAVLLAGPDELEYIGLARIHCPFATVAEQYQEDETFHLRTRRVVAIGCGTIERAAPDAFYLGWQEPRQALETVKPLRQLEGNFFAPPVHDGLPPRTKTPIQLRRNYSENRALIEAAPNSSWLGTGTDFSRRVSIRFEAARDKIDCKSDGSGLAVRKSDDFWMRSVPDPEGGYLFLKSEDGTITEMLLSDIPKAGLKLGGSTAWQQITPARRK